MADALAKLVGKKFPFYGVDNNSFRLGIDTFDALEDESDGYRSYLRSIRRNKKNRLFFKTPLARVRVERRDGKFSDFEGYELVDTRDARVWLRIGTNTYDEWYPYFVFEYQPK